MILNEVSFDCFFFFFFRTQKGTVVRGNRIHISLHASFSLAIDFLHSSVFAIPQEEEEEDQGKEEMRKKNPHPQRAVNARTVLKGDREERGGEEEGDVERLRRILTCVPCRDVVMEQNQMREEETTFVAKGVKRKRGHECDVCEKVFGYPSLLATHMRTHANEKPYECDVCEKRFTTSGNLQNHMRIHTNEKPYECDVCEMKFRRSGDLKKHKRTQY